MAHATTSASAIKAAVPATPLQRWLQSAEAALGWLVEIPAALLVVAEIVCQRLKRRGQRRRIAGPEIVDRVDESLAEQLAPHPVDDRLHEPRVVVGRHPIGDDLPPASPRPQFRAVEKLGRHVDIIFVRAERLLILVDRRHDQPVFQFYAKHADHGREHRGLFHVGRPSLREAGGELFEVVLLPLLGLVVMALGALNLHAEEQF